MLPVSRRGFLLGLAVSPIALSLGCTTRQSSADGGGKRPLPIPPLAESTIDDQRNRVFSLRAAPGTSEIRAGQHTPTWGYNGAILGPTLRARDGETVTVRFENALPEPTSVHWHGMHVPANCDGGPHQPVAPGGQWRPTWTIRQPAATLWYHPHPHGATEKHIYRGLAGLFIVDDAGSEQLPHEYGVDDIPLIIQDRRFTASGELDESDPTDVGLLGDTIITNGVTDAFLRVRSDRVRLRILNGSGGRLYNLGFSDDRSFHIVASDGGLLAAPVETTRVRLSPGERAEIVVELRSGSAVSLRSFAFDDRAGVAPSESKRCGLQDTFEILALRADPTLRSGPDIPAVLAAVPAPDISNAAATRNFDLRWFMINRKRMDMAVIDFNTTVDTTEIWTVHNTDNWPHNFHVHDTQFRVIDIDGSPPPPALAGYKDTVYVAPGQRIALSVRFADYTDAMLPYMYHCHLAMHEDRGMMGQFLVLAPGQTPAPMPEQMHAGHHSMS
ncbi:multicopper oxidase domain-containing protein [Mycobacterium sp. M26]|uniref:multicopper oxidase family protein n=1 Tax=Mycobacterium sp. M26 TaxID=1762962 RepID=UPI00073EC679|nr:multicopper oxidase domain-containing protein [Mycobacterium sp. M26]